MTVYARLSKRMPYQMMHAKYDFQWSGMTFSGVAPSEQAAYRHEIEGNQPLHVPNCAARSFTRAC